MHAFAPRIDMTAEDSYLVSHDSTAWTLTTEPSPISNSPPPPFIYNYVFIWGEAEHIHHSLHVAVRGHSQGVNLSFYHMDVTYIVYTKNKIKSPV